MTHEMSGRRPTARRTCGRVLALALGVGQWADASWARADAEVLLENEFARIAVDPRHGGAVTAMIMKKATTFPLIADKGADLAGRGRFFTAVVSVGDRSLDLATLPLRAASSRDRQGEQVLVQEADLASLAPGLAFERTIRMGREESGFRVEDAFRNDGPGAGDITLRLDARSRLQAEPWRVTMLGGFGDASAYLAGSGTMEARSPRFYWRIVGPFGVGFLQQMTTPAAPVTISHALSEESGHAADLRWRTGDIPLAAGKTVAFAGAVLIDAGARGGSAEQAAALAGSDRVIVTADLRLAGESGDLIPGGATVVSAVPRRAKLVAKQSHREPGRAPESPETVAEIDLALEPGESQVRPLEFKARRRGTLHVELEVFDERGEALARSAARSVIDGEGMPGEAGEIWKTYVRKMPEQTYRGTWGEIGTQLAEAGKIKAKPAGAGSAERWGFVHERFPFYAELIQGAARALDVAPEGLALADPAADAAREGCMDIFFNGPDGPINAFSKERDGPSLDSLGYLKMLPARGYRYHMYTMPPDTWSHGYGVNSEGLSTSGATINCDAETTRHGREVTAAWKRSGKQVAPLGVHMMLATCKDVDEAIAFIEDPAAPFEFEGNMLIVDRAGRAARLESVGIHRQIHRFGRPGEGCFAAGNYPHERPDGHFKLGRWDWAANTMLRELLIDGLTELKDDRVDLNDAFRIMGTHAPGGMCQHILENPGKLYSSTSYIAVTRTSDLWLSHGPPCQVRYYRYSLDREGK